MIEPAGVLKPSYRASAKFSAGCVRLSVGKFGVERTNPIDVSHVNRAEGVREYVSPALRWWSKNGMANEGSMAVWLGLVNGPSTLFKLNRKKSRALSEMRWSMRVEN